MNENTVWVLDNDFNVIHVVDDFISFIWIDKYCGYGNFELALTLDQFDVGIYKKDFYLSSNHTDRMMIIEDISLHNSYEEDSYYLIKGRSLESILTRRVIWPELPDHYNIASNVEHAIADNLIDANHSSRQIPIFYTGEPINVGNTDYAEPDEQLPYWESVFLGDNVYDFVVDQCNHIDEITTWPTKWKGKWPHESKDEPKKFKIGFKVIYDEYFKRMTFYLYKGVDRSFDQTKRPTVEFSRFMGNLGDYDYIYSSMNYKNSAMMRGNFLSQYKETDDDGNYIKDEDGNYKYGYEDNYIFRSVSITLPSSENKYHLGRREIFVDTDVERRKKNGEGELTDNLYTQTQFVNKMNKQGFKELYNYQESTDYNVEILSQMALNQYEFRKDYDLGDIVQVDTGDTGSIKAMVSEVTCSWDTSDGYRVFPSFEFIYD